MPFSVGVVILAGGRATRLGGGDKPLFMLAGRPLLAHQIERLHDCHGRIILNANGSPERFDAFGLPVRADVRGNHLGPLAGVLAGLIWAEQAGFDSLLSVPGDCPFLPRDLLPRLASARDGGGNKKGRAVAACAASGGRVHFATTLWPVDSLPLVSSALDVGIRRVEDMLNTIGYICVDWHTMPYDPFFNINTPDDARQAEHMLRDMPDQCL